MGGAPKRREFPGEMKNQNQIIPPISPISPINNMLCRFVIRRYSICASHSFVIAQQETVCST